MKVLTYNEIKSAEANAVKLGVSYSSLMEKAGKSAAKVITEKYDLSGKTVDIVCGNGNNGGDGIVIANLLKNFAKCVNIICPMGLPKTETATPFVKDIKDICIKDTLSGNADVIIDAFFGIGLNRDITDNNAEIIGKMNKSSAFKISVDIPSGIYPDGGHSRAFFKPDITVTFIGYKLCFLLPQTSSFCGEVFLCDLELNPQAYSYEIIDKPMPLKMDKNSHKGTYGTALLICGSYGMCGAQILSSKAALHSGVGLVKTIVCDKNYSAVTASLPEVVTIPVETSDDGAPIIFERTLLSSVSSSNAVLIGCGLGNTDETFKLLKRTIELSSNPIIIDADGINALARDIDMLRRAKTEIIISPHPKELARLLDTTADDIQNNRIRYSKFVAEKYGCIVVLKGANTIVATPDGRVYFNITGNPGMATAGSGDVLAGMIVAELAKGCTPINAAINSVYRHGMAGDIAAQKLGQTFMTASDIISELKTQF